MSVESLVREMGTAPEEATAIPGFPVADLILVLSLIVQVLLHPWRPQ